MTETAMPSTIHEGHNIKRIRELLGVKQEKFAAELGPDWTQKKISQLEQKETIEPELLEQVAKALKVPVEAIRNFNEEAAIFNIQHNYEGTSNNSIGYKSTFNFNPIDKIVQLYEEKAALYERMLQAEKDKNALLEKLVADRKK